MKTFEALKVWKRSHALTLELYKLTREFPADERFGLTTQLRRAAVSVVANLAEGCKRSSRPDFARHVAIARGSAAEADSLVLLSSDLGYINTVVATTLRKELDEIQRMLTGLWVTLSERG